MPVFQTLIYALSGLAIGLTALPLSRSPKWWIRLWDYPRLQLSAALTVVCVLQLAVLPQSILNTSLFIVTFACLCWQLWSIYPYTPLKRRQVLAAGPVDHDNAISILLANVLQENRNSQGLLQQVADRDADLVLLVETSRWWDERIAGLAERYPFYVRHPLENTYGMHLFSRLELSEISVLDRVEKDVPSISAQVRLRSGHLIKLYCVHPEPPQVGNDVDERDAELLLVAREVAKDGRPSIVCGDLNDVAWSHTTRLFQRTSGLLDPRVGRGLFPTFHAEHWWARWPLDHVFHDASFRLGNLAVLDYFGSDHFPIFVQLVHDPTAARQHEKPKADAKDREEAAQKILDGRD